MKKLSVVLVMLVMLMSASFAIDNLAPTLSVSEKDGSTLATGTTIKVMVEDENKVTQLKYNWEGVAVRTVTPNTNAVTLNLKIGTQSGKYVLNVEALDSEGNSTGKKQYVYYVEEGDYTAPEIVPNFRNGSTVKAGEVIKLDMEDENEIVQVKYNWEGQTEKIVKPNTNLLTLNLKLATQSGKYVLNVEAIDSEGNSTGKKQFVYYVEDENVDTNAPKITVLEKSGSTLPGGASVSVKVEDENEIAQVKYSWSGNTERVLTPNKTSYNLKLGLGTQSGKYVLNVEAIDVAGNSSGKQQYVYYVEEGDYTAPEIVPDFRNGSTVKAGETIQLDMKDENKIVQVKYNWEGQTAKIATPNTTVCTLKLRIGTQSGKYVLNVEALDSKGNSTGKKQFVYYVEETDDEVPEIMVNVKSGSSVTAGTIIRLELEDKNKITQVMYGWNDNSMKTLNPNRNEIILQLKVGTQSGTYKLRVTARDEFGNSVNQTYTYHVKAADTKAPTISSNRTSGERIAKNAAIKITIKDESKLAKVEYTWNGARKILTPTSNTATLNLKMGNKNGTLRVTAEDSEGNRITKTYNFVCKNNNQSKVNVIL